jgi:hypothetical protein
MKRNSISKTLAALSLISAAAFAGSAQADSARLSIGFGGFCPPARVVAYDGHRYQHDYRWQDRQHQRHDGFGPASHIDQRQWQQHQRIADGIRTGELTPREVRHLGREQAQIRHMEHRFLADGRMSPREWRYLDRELDDASRNIWRQKHDYQDRY